MAQQEELKNIAPELSKLKKEQAFGTPRNYFDDLSARIHTKIQQEKQPEQVQKTRIIQFLKPALGLAASFALIVMLVYVPLKLFVKQEQPEVAANGEYTDTDFRDLMTSMDESTFFAVLEDEEENDTRFTEEELQMYVDANFTDYEIFEFTQN